MDPGPGANLGIVGGGCYRGIEKGVRREIFSKVIRNLLGVIWRTSKVR